MLHSQEEDEEPKPAEVAVLADKRVDDDDDAAGGDDDDVGNLFGSDDDDDDDAGALVPVVAEPSAEPVEFALPSQSRPPASGKLFLVRLPNILRFQPRPFTAENYDEDDDAVEAGESGSVKGANVIRWRESASGERQSNARIVKWSDGSMTLHVGDEVLTTKQVAVPEGSTHLYTKHKDSNLECHGVIKHKLTMAPASRESKTHQALSKSIAQNHTKTKRIQNYTTTEDPERKKREDERTWEDKKRLEMRQTQRRARNEEATDQQSLTTDFLDADDDEPQLEGNLGLLKQKFKQHQKKGGSRPAAGGGKRRAGGGSYAAGGKKRRMGLYKDRGSDEDNSQDSEQEDSEEEEDTGELDDFIVQGSEDEDAGSDEEEAVESDESEEERPKKKGKGKAKPKKKSRLVEEDSDDD